MCSNPSMSMTTTVNIAHSSAVIAHWPNLAEMNFWGKGKQILDILQIYGYVVKEHRGINSVVTDVNIYTVIILCMHPPDERLRYIGTSSLIGWVRIQNDPWFSRYYGNWCLGGEARIQVIGRGATIYSEKLSNKRSESYSLFAIRLGVYRILTNTIAQSTVLLCSALPNKHTIMLINFCKIGNAVLLLLGAVW